MNNSARISELHYRYQTGINKEKQDKETKKKLKKIGYKLDTKNTDKDVLTAVKDNNVHINFTGTNIKNPRDIISDVALGTGVQRLNPQFRERRKKTREIMREYGDDKEYTLSGHSLGGSIGLDMMSRSKSIRDRVKETHFFNPGYTGMFHDSIKVNDKKIKKELNNKVNIYRVKGDIVSAHANKETAFGNLFEFNHKDKEATITDKHSLDTFKGEEPPSSASPPSPFTP
jgi:hypothetical protein